MVGRLCVPKVLAETPAGTQVRKAAKKSLILAEEGGDFKICMPRRRLARGSLGAAWRM